jgi:hypothetical protein
MAVLYRLGRVFVDDRVVAAKEVGLAAAAVE